MSYGKIIPLIDHERKRTDARLEAIAEIQARTDQLNMEIGDNLGDIHDEMDEAIDELEAELKLVLTRMDVLEKATETLRAELRELKASLTKLGHDLDELRN